MTLLELIEASAVVPSFSTYEERLHPLVKEVVSGNKDAKLIEIKDNNLLVFVVGREGVDPVVLTSHLDKINHFGEDYPEELSFEVSEGKIKGQMDNSVGVGICLHFIREAAVKDYPPLIVLFSEMEESTGLKHHPHLLKNNGKDVGPQIGAKRLSAYLDEQNIDPQIFITIDTTPIFKGDSGVALYSAHWEKTEVMPDDELRGKIEEIKKAVLSVDSEVVLANGTNDYMIYGSYFGVKEKGNIPSIAIEPAIFPYHQAGEEVFVKDVNRIVSLLDNLLLNYF